MGLEDKKEKVLIGNEEKVRKGNLNADAELRNLKILEK